jgi:2-polyprenyl-6-methoxyphenol hydroxylase-like FAD-dependent oxidoreductase
MPDGFDVAIVGYGPVGQTLAILLAQRGWRVGVFERQPAPYPLPRAVHFDHEVGRILQAAGIADDLAGRTETADAYEWRNAAGDTLLCFTSRALAPSGWPEANMFAQPDLERLLDARVHALPGIAVHRGHEVVAVDPHAPALEVATPDGARRSVVARWIVGCDGANSFVRTQVGATVTDLGFFFDWLIVDVLPARPTVWRPLNVQVCDPARPTTLVSGGPGRRRWEFMRLPEESIEELDREATAWRLLAPWDVTPANARLERHTVYRFQARWVDGWRRGAVVLAGDAAHQMPPFAGQGMCSGLRDAANLAWKLDLVLAGTAPDELLDTYGSERMPHVRSTIEMSMALGRVICVPDPVEAAARDRAMIAATRAGTPTVPPPGWMLGPGAFAAGDPHAGALFVQGRVARGARSGLFDDVIGGGWVLLGRDGVPRLDGEAAAFFARLRGTVAGLGADGVRDLDGVYARWFADAGVATVLQRPDFYVFGTAATLDANALVGRLRGVLREPRA